MSDTGIPPCPPFTSQANHTMTTAQPFFRPDPSRAAGDMAAAITLGLVRRHAEPGYIWLRGRGRLSVAEAISQGVTNEPGAALVAALEGCMGAPPAPVVLSTIPSRQAAPYEGTLIGDLVAALQVWVRRPEAEEGVLALGKAFEAFQLSAVAR